MSETKADLERRIAELEDENAQLRAREPEARAPEQAKRRYMTDDAGNRVLSAGEENDLREHGVAVSPFDGARLNALDWGIEPGNPEAQRRAERAQLERGDVTEGGDPNAWPVSGPPPAAGGDADPHGTNAHS